MHFSLRLDLSLISETRGK